MKIKLEHVLKRNKTSLKIFLEKNQIKTYEQLEIYCRNRRFIPCDKKDFELILPPAKKIVPLKKEETIVRAEGEVKNENRVVNLPQEKKTKRPSTRKARSSQPISGSNK